MKISVCYTTFKRTDLLFESVKPFLNDDRVSEIVISDDCSPMHIYAELEGFFTGMDKIKLYHNERNLDCFCYVTRAFLLNFVHVHAHFSARQWRQCLSNSLESTHDLKKRDFLGNF